jgi:drug/metabolite transporter (DMT)-like permease
VLVSISRSGFSASDTIWIVVAAAVAQGLYHPLTRPLLRNHSGVEVATYAIITATILTLPFVPFGWSQLVSAPVAAWLGAAYLGVFPSALGFVLWGYAVSRLPISTSTSLLYLVPPVAVLISFLWLGELPYLGEILGGLVVVVGVVGISQGERIATHVRRRALVPVKEN